MNEREKVVASLRELADWLESRPAVKFDTCPTFDVYCGGAKEFPQIGREIGTADKVATDYHFSFRKMFGVIRVDWFVDRDAICHKVKIGEKVIPAEAEKIIPAKPEQTVEVFEWVCPDSLLAPVEGPAVAR